MITLLLALFIVLFAVSTINTKKFEALGPRVQAELLAQSRRSALEQRGRAVRQLDADGRTPAGPAAPEHRHADKAGGHVEPGVGAVGVG